MRYQLLLFLGHETKAMLNNGGPRYKRSSLERQMNQDVIWCVFILIFLCLVGALGCRLWLKTYPNITEPFKSEYGDTTESILAFFTFVIILQVCKRPIQRFNSNNSICQSLKLYVCFRFRL